MSVTIPAASRPRSPAFSGGARSGPTHAGSARRRRRRSSARSTGSSDQVPLVGLEGPRRGDGDVLYEHNAENRLLPASNKLFTSTAAMDVLGPDYRFTTSVRQTGRPATARLLGNLTSRAPVTRPCSARTTTRWPSGRRLGRPHRRRQPQSRTTRTSTTCGWRRSGLDDEPYYYNGADLGPDGRSEHRLDAGTVMCTCAGAMPAPRSRVRGAGQSLRAFVGTATTGAAGRPTR